MPSPESDLEQLLSASLDGELTPEQQLELDQVFRTDPELARQRDELVALRGLVRQSFLSQRPQGLGRGFADRVIDAAIAKAEAEGVRSDHPLVRLAHGDASTDSRFDRNAPDGNIPARYNWRHAGALAALAASIAFVAFLSNRLRDREPSGSREVASGKSQVIQGIASQPLDDPNNPSDSATKTKEVSPVPTNQIAVSPNPTPNPNPIKPVPTKPVPPASAADPMPAQIANNPPAGGVDLPVGGVKLAAVMVVAFDLTEHGEDIRALDQALAAEGIRLGARGELDDEMVDELVESRVIAAGDESNATDDPWEVYFVQAPATQISSLVDRLSRDDKSFDDFSWGIASDPDGSIDVVEQFAVSPTKAPVDELAFARGLVDTDGDAAQFRRGLGLMAMNDTQGLRGILPQSTSPSEMSHLLLLVK